jgi:hypothetical protein
MKTSWNPEGEGTLLFSGQVAANSTHVEIGFLDKENDLWDVDSDVDLQPGDEVVIILRRKGERGLHPLLWLLIPWFCLVAALLALVSVLAVIS